MIVSLSSVLEYFSCLFSRVQQWNVEF